MTIQRKYRKRLRQYALFCSIVAAVTGLIHSSATSHAANTHDSGELCGWVEQTKNNLSDENRDAPTAARPSRTPGKAFIAVFGSEELLIDTCSYDEWLSAKLSRSGDLACNACLRTEKNQVPDRPEMEVDPERTAIQLGNADDVEKEETRAGLSRTSTKFNRTLAAMVAAATDGKRLQLGQWIEPFAIIGSDGGDSVEQIEAFQAWFAERKPVGKQTRQERAREIETVVDHDALVPVVDFDGTIDDETPVVTRQATQRVVEIVETTHDRATSVPKPTTPPAERFVGTSAIISTIKEAYMPYDLALRDLDGETSATKPLDEHGPKSVRTIGVLAPMAKPFCLRSLVVIREPGWSPLASNVAASPSTSDASIQLSNNELLRLGSAECLLDECLWRVGNFVEEKKVSREWLRPIALGRQVAKLVVSSDEVAEQIASRLAQIWPKANRPAGPIVGAGARLLARAEAAEQLSPDGSADPSSEKQLAQAIALLVQWVDATQRVVDDFTNQWSEVTEVARHRGTQDDPNRR